MWGGGANGCACGHVCVSVCVFSCKRDCFKTVTFIACKKHFYLFFLFPLFFGGEGEGHLLVSQVEW